MNKLLEFFKQRFNKNNDKSIIMEYKNMYTLNNDKTRVNEVTFINSPNYGKTIVPSILVLHYTAGGSLEGAVTTFKKPESVSAHFVIDRDGTIVQMVELDKKAFHAGISSYNNRNGVNDYSIGIEIVNWGICGNGEEPITWTKKTLDKNDCTKVYGSWWHNYTKEQLESVKELCLTLIKELKLTAVVGHSDIAPGRKVDPGPLLKEFIEDLKKSGQIIK
jgi:N-acetylmuramoyl-L-alanine amidase